MPDIPVKYWIMVATLGFVWGSTFLLTELAIEDLSPLWLATSRICLGSVLLTLFWGLRGFKLFPEESAWGRMTFVAIFSSVVPFFLIGWGQQYVTSGFAGISMAAIALMILPLAHVFLPDEKMNLRKVFGFVVGFIGVAFLMGGDVLASSGSSLETWGRFSLLGATACYAVCSIVLRKMPAADPVGLSAVLLLIGAAVILPIALIVEGLPPAIPQDTLIVIAVLGLIPTAAANLLRVRVIREAGSTFMSLVNYQVPVWSVVMGALILGEPLPATMLLALLLILSGVAVSQYGALKRMFTRG